MEIKIVSRWDNSKIILCGEYESIKDCLEKNKGAYLEGADLKGAYLESADLKGAYLESADLKGADLEGADLKGAYLESADLKGAYLKGAYLKGADLESADLEGADLEGAYLRGAKNYLSSRDFWVEIIRRQPLETFTEKEWAIIGQVYVHKLCWDSIKKRYGADIMPIFKKLSAEKFDKWEKYYEGYLKEQRNEA